jgi:hypothetical protein
MKAIMEAEQELNKVCRDLRKDRQAQQWLHEHPDTRKVLATVEFDE